MTPVATSATSLSTDGQSPPAKALYFFNHSLYVPRMTADDAGRYQCHVAFN